MKLTLYEGQQTALLALITLISDISFDIANILSVKLSLYEGALLTPITLISVISLDFANLANFN